MTNNGVSRFFCWVAMAPICDSKTTVKELVVADHWQMTS
jgi:hypothetical protein